MAAIAHHNDDGSAIAPTLAKPTPIDRHNGANDQTQITYPTNANVGFGMQVGGEGEEKDSGGKRPSDRPACFHSTLQECLFVMTATMAIAMSSFGMGALSVIYADIAKALHMSSAEVTWISASTGLSAGSFLLFFGKVADTFGRRPLLLIAFAGFSLAMLVSGFAITPIYIDVLQGIAGLFSAAAVPPAVGALGAVYSYPSERKNKAFACFSAGNPLGFVVGSLLSGVAAKVAGWRAAIWVVAVVYAAFGVLAWWTFPAGLENDGPRKEKGWAWREISRFDFVGTGLTVGGIGMFSGSLSLAGDAPKGWATSYVIALLILGIALMGAFIYWESVYEYPLMPLRVWKDRNFSMVMLTLLLGFTGFTAVSFWISLYMQQILHYSPLSTAVHLIPQATAGIIVNVIAGLILHRVSNKLLAAIGALSYVASFVLLALMRGGETLTYWAFIFPGLILSVVGADFQFNVANMYVMSSLPLSQQSLAGGLFQTVTKLCSTLGLGITTAVFSRVNSRNGYVSIAANHTDSAPYRAVFWATAGLAGVGLVVCAWVRIGVQGTNTPPEGRVSLEKILVDSGLTRKEMVVPSEKDKVEFAGRGEKREGGK